MNSVCSCTAVHIEELDLLLQVHITIANEKISLVSVQCVTGQSCNFFMQLVETQASECKNKKKMSNNIILWDYTTNMKQVLHRCFHDLILSLWTSSQVPYKHLWGSNSWKYVKDANICHNWIDWNPQNKKPCRYRLHVN